MRTALLLTPKSLQTRRACAPCAGSRDTTHRRPVLVLAAVVAAAAPWLATSASASSLAESVAPMVAAAPASPAVVVAPVAMAVAGAAPAGLSMPAVQVYATRASAGLQDSPFGVFCYEAIGATPRVRLPWGNTDAPAAATGSGALTRSATAP